NPSRHLESENLKSRILDPDGRPSTKGFIRQALSVLCVLGGSPFFGSRRYEVARYCLHGWSILARWEFALNSPFDLLSVEKAHGRNQKPPFSATLAPLLAGNPVQEHRSFWGANPRRSNVRRGATLASSEPPFALR